MKGYQIRGKYLAIERDTTPEKMGTSGLTYSSADAESMSVHKGKVLGTGIQVQGVAEGALCYYNKSRAFELKLQDGSTVVMVHEDYIIMIIEVDS